MSITTPENAVVAVPDGSAELGAAQEGLVEEDLVEEVSIDGMCGVY